MEVCELVDSIENSILAKFQHPMSCSFVVQGCKNHKKKLFFFA
jgi:hypothetical protein